MTKNRRPAKKAAVSPEQEDPLYDHVLKHWADILKLYRVFEQHRPIMLFDVQEEKVYAYPYEDFKADLSERSQKMLVEQYRKAIEGKTIVVFVRDNDERKLVSYSVG